MSTTCRENLFNIGARLREERDRLGLSQEALGTRIGTTGRTIKKYEANETSIRAVELLQFSGLGADVLFIVTGERLPLGGNHPTRTACSPAERVASFIAELPLSDEDAALLRAMAERLSR